MLAENSDRTEADMPTITFSNRTLVRLCEVMDAEYSHSGLDVLVFEFELESLDKGGNKQNRSLALLRGIRSDLPPEQAQKTMVELIERMAYRCRSSATVLAALKIDGLEFTEDDRLVPTAPIALETGLLVSTLELALENLGLRVALTHFRHSVNNFTDGQLESSNGDIRSFMENLL
jgi:hypothetical protein